MKRLTFVLAFFVTTLSFGQRETGIKLYQNSDFFLTHFSQTNTKHNYNFTRLSLAINFSGKRFIHEVEAFVPEISKSIYNVKFPYEQYFNGPDYYKIRVNTYSIRYGISKTLIGTSPHLHFNLGVGVNPYFISEADDPKDPNYIRISRKTYGISFNITPCLVIKVAKRWSVDLSVPLKIYDLRHYHLYVPNPSIPIAQQTRNVWDDKFFEAAYTVRFGVIFKLKG